MSYVTYFKAQLPCKHCAKTSTAWIDNKLGNKGATYQVGDCPDDDIQRVDFEDTCLEVRRPDGDTISVMLPWTCSECHLGNWAEVVFANGCIRSITTVELDPAALARANYISRHVDEDFEALVGEPFWTETGPRPDWLSLLRRALE